MLVFLCKIAKKKFENRELFKTGLVAHVPNERDAILTFSSQKVGTVCHLTNGGNLEVLAGGDTGRLFRYFGGLAGTGSIANCPLGKVLTYKKRNLLIKCPTRDTCLYMVEATPPAPLDPHFSFHNSFAAIRRILFIFGRCMQ